MLLVVLLLEISEPGIDGKLVPGDRIDIAQVRKVGHGEAGNCSPPKKTAPRIRETSISIQRFFGCKETSLHLLGVNGLGGFTALTAFLTETPSWTGFLVINMEVSITKLLQHVV